MSEGKTYRNKLLKKSSETFDLPKSPSFMQNAMKRFRKNKLSRFAFWIISIMIFTAVFADFIAYNKPIYAKYNGQTYFPIFKDYMVAAGIGQWEKDLVLANWDELELESSLWPPIRYLPGDIDYKNTQSKSPFEKQRVAHWKYWHFLGTDNVGRDVMSGLIHGTRISLTIGVVAIGIATIIGVILGALGGYFGDNRIKMTRAGIIFTSMGMLLGYFYAFRLRSYTLVDALETGVGNFMLQLFFSLFIFGFITFCFYQFSRLLRLVPWLKEKRYIWADIIISRVIEIMVAIPSLLLIITVSGIVHKGSIYLVMVIIGLTGWTGIARFMRGEMLRTRNQAYIESARALGYSEWRILFRHALPNAIAPVLVAIAFGIAGAILVESSLSFLGIGVPVDTVTWGSLLTGARNDVSAWWLTIFPGSAIFLTVTAFNLLGEGFRDALDPRLAEE